MAVLKSVAAASVSVLFSLVAFLVLLIYIVYQRYFHPLSKYPGPFLASITDLWQVSVLRTGRLPSLLVDLHEKYGTIVRIGPKELSFNDSNAVTDIYKAGRVVQKGPLYDGFTSFKPNVFGLRDEDKHSLRRRQMAHSFSITALRTMEPIFDQNVKSLMSVLSQRALTGDAFDLKDLISRYQYDLMGNLAFDDDFNAVQSAHPLSHLSANPVPLPPFNNNFYLAHIYGMMPSLLPWTMKLGKYVPLAWMQELIQSREVLKNHTIYCVRRSLQNSEKERDRSLLSYVIEAADPMTGEKLAEVDICTEAFGFLVAGSITTSTSLTLLFSHLLANPAALQALVHELDNVLAEIPGDEIHEFAGMEQTLPYTLACVRENFRMAATSSFPLQRQILASEGLVVSGRHLPQGTLVTMVPHTLHHNASIWGSDHARFNPTRWLSDSSKNYPGPASEKNLMHFGNGHRVCMGRNLATMSIWKVVTTVLSRFELELVDLNQRDSVVETVTLGVTERKGPLMVRVRERQKVVV